MGLGLALGLFASVAWGIVDVGAAVSTRRVGSARVLLLTQLISVVVLGLLVAMRPDLMGPSPLAGMLAGLPLGLTASSIYLSQFMAFRLGPVSIVSPVIVAYGGFTVVLAVLFRGETLTVIQGVGAMVATVGVILAAITFEEGSLRGVHLVGPGVVAAIVASVGFAVVTVFMAGPIGEFGFLPVIVGSRLGNTAVSALILLLALKGHTRLRPLAQPWLGWSRLAVGAVLICGMGDIAGLIAFSIGLEVAPAWLLGLSSSFGPVLAIAWAVLHLGERLRPHQWVGVLALGAGVVTLAVAG